MKQVTIYTTPTCPYCVRAKQLLSSLDVPYTEVNVAENTAERERIMNDYNWRTVPAIFAGDELLGGFDDINALHQNGELMPKLNA